MKKALLLLALASSLATASMAGNNELTGLQRRKGMISNGFYVFLGFGLPTGTRTTTGIQTTTINNYNSSYYSYDFSQPYSTSSSYTGINISAEIGNQFMFYKTDNFGIGLNASWITLGYNSLSATYSNPLYQTSVKSTYSQFELNVLRFGPMASFALSEDAAIDAFFNVSPTAYVGLSDAGGDSYTTVGVLFVPGARIRYKKLAVGIELQMGSTKGTTSGGSSSSTYNYATNSYNYVRYSDEDIKISVFKPRLTVGFKF